MSKNIGVFIWFCIKKTNTNLIYWILELTCAILTKCTFIKSFRALPCCLIFSLLLKIHKYSIDVHLLKNLLLQEVFFMQVKCFYQFKWVRSKRQRGGRKKIYAFMLNCWCGIPWKCEISSPGWLASWHARNNNHCGGGEQSCLTGSSEGVSHHLS